MYSDSRTTEGMENKRKYDRSSRSDYYIRYVSDDRVREIHEIDKTTALRPCSIYAYVNNVGTCVQMTILYQKKKSTNTEGV